jgi:hypothetical protein
MSPREGMESKPIFSIKVEHRHFVSVTMRNFLRKMGLSLKTTKRLSLKTNNAAAESRSQ